MSQAVKNDKLVTLSVKMADMTGKVLEETGPEGLTYWHGHGDIFPKLEAALEGRFPGEGFFIQLQPHEAFGDYDAESILVVPLRELAEDPEAIVPGLVFEQLPHRESDGRRWYVTDVADGMAVLEPNHPYAGWGLQFEVKVLSVEDPEASEAVTAEDVVVPGFLSVANSNGSNAGNLIPEDDEDVDEAQMDALLAAHQHVTH